MCISADIKAAWLGVCQLLAAIVLTVADDRMVGVPISEPDFADLMSEYEIRPSLTIVNRSGASYAQ